MENKILHNKLLIFLTIVYIIAIYSFNFCTINYHVKELLIVSVPFFIFILMYFLLKKEKIKGWLGNIIMAISTFFFIITMLLMFVMICFDEGTSFEDNPLRYEYIRNIAGYTEYTYQFPDRLPNDIVHSDKVKFYYTPQFLQGAFNFSLLLSLEQEEINDYIMKYKDKAKMIIDMKENNEIELKKYIISEPYGVLDNGEYKEFIKDAQFYIFESEPYKIDDWNHGLMQYMAQNTESNQLLLVTKIW